MSDLEYLQSVLRDQTLSNDSAEIKKLRSHRNDVEAILNSAFDGCVPTIRYGGSYAKNTMIREHYDLDVMCYFKHDDTSAGDTLKEIYDNVAKAFTDKYFVEKKKSALRLRGKGQEDYQVDFHVDVVPGRFTDDKKDDVFIYQQGAEKERMKTNLEKHITHIRDSGLTEAIRLAKLWNTRRMLGVKTFVLDLMVVKLLAPHKSKSLDKQLLKFWESIVEAEGNVPVEDPANPSGNDLSEFNSQSQQLMLHSAAQGVLVQIENAGWQAVFGEVASVDKAEVLGTIAARSDSRTKPWAEIAR